MTQTFDIADALPEGTTVLEASAGTGKTWTVGALVARYVAEGEATLDEMLLITFSRAASQELRERVRAALVEAERALADPDGPTAPTRSSALACRRRGRARRARTPAEGRTRGLRRATIATTHEFCQLVLRLAGRGGRHRRPGPLVEDLTDLVAEVTDDLYLARFGGQESAAVPAGGRPEPRPGRRRGPPGDDHPR